MRASLPAQSVELVYLKSLSSLMALVLGLWLWGGLDSSAQAASSCITLNQGPLYPVARVVDGDTLKLQDGRSVRLIGINTPEVDHDDQPAEPGGIKAQEVALRLVQGKAVRLRFEEDRQDEHGRWLAHVFLADGRNLGAMLLEQGYALLAMVPPNTDQWRCFQTAEDQARRKRLGLWQGEWSRMSAGNLRRAKGFALWRGTLLDIKPTRHSVWLNLEQGYQVRIAREDLDRFSLTALQARLHQPIEVRGWWNQYNGRATLRLRHPSMLRE